MFVILRAKGAERKSQVRLLSEFIHRARGEYSQIGVFIRPLKTVIDSGYDPISWQYKGNLQPPPDQRVYESMLPRKSATVFWEWANEKLKKKNDWYWSFKTPPEEGLRQRQLRRKDHE